MKDSNKKTISTTELREDIYKKFDRIIMTGAPLRVNRNNKILEIKLVEKQYDRDTSDDSQINDKPRIKNDLSKLKKRKLFVDEDFDIDNYSAWEDGGKQEWEKEWDDFFNDDKK